MSDDVTDRLPRDTNPILERILEELRALRELPATSARLETKLDALRAELVATRRVLRDELGLETTSTQTRLDDVERRLRAIEERLQPQ
jgi:hypothetical protein